MLDIWDRAGPFRGDQWNPQKGRAGRVMQLFQGFLCGSPCLCRLRTEGLVPMGKYWTYRLHAGDMGPVNLVACCWQIFSLSALLQWLCWERNWDGSHGPLSRAERWSREHFFSGTVNLSNSVGSVWKVAMYVDWRGKHTCRVGRVFPCRVYNDSNRRDSQIWVTACS
jgi:hypothetical protein